MTVGPRTVPLDHRIYRPHPFTDVIPMPPANPPLGHLTGDELYPLTHAERVAAEAVTGYRHRDLAAEHDEAAQHDRYVDQLVTALRPRPRDVAA